MFFELFKAKSDAFSILDAALKAADHYLLMKNAIEVEGGVLRVFDKKFKIRGEVYLLAFGKAACSMAGTVTNLFGKHIKRA